MYYFLPPGSPKNTAFQTTEEESSYKGEEMLMLNESTKVKLKFKVFMFFTEIQHAIKKLHI
jgi:hypothetical protein